MTPRLPAALIALAVGLGPTSAHAAPAAKENPGSTSGASEAEILRRVGYRAPQGAHPVGKLYPDKTGDQVAFFEQRGDTVQLVVAIKGGAAARWPVSPDTARLQVIWVGPSELVLGTDTLAPKVRVKWYVARAP